MEVQRERGETEGDREREREGGREGGRCSQHIVVRYSSTRNTLISSIHPCSP